MATPDVLSEDSVFELLRDLISIPSVNPTLAPHEPGGEAKLAKYARDWLVDRGVEARLEEAAPDRPNVVGEVGGGDGPTLVLCGHIDTVSALEMTVPPFEARRDRDRVYGRGSYDMKGGVAAIMAALAALPDEDLGGRVVAALVVDEEHSSAGADDFVSRHPGDACIVTEPTEGKLILAHKGFVWAELVTSGRAAHGSRWDLGVSAIGRMGRIVAALERFDAEVLRKRTDPRLGPPSLHCSIIAGGIGVSTYAPECRLQIERRTLPGEAVEGVSEELKRVVRGAGEEAALNCYFHREPLVCDPDAAIARCVRESATTAIGAAPEETGVGYWTDAAVFAAAGMPALLYGPGGEGAHAAVEWVDLPSVVSCARVLREAALRFCRGG